MDPRDPLVSAALAWWRAHLRCAEPREGPPGDPGCRPPAGCELPTQARWDRSEWVLVSTPAAFETRALSALAEGREMHALVNPLAVPDLAPRGIPVISKVILELDSELEDNIRAARAVLSFLAPSLGGARPRHIPMQVLPTPEYGMARVTRARRKCAWIEIDGQRSSYRATQQSYALCCTTSGISL